VVASQCPQNYFISEKYENLHSFRLHLLQNCPIYKSAFLTATVKMLKPFHFMRAFSALRRILNYIGRITKVASFEGCIQSRKRPKINWSQIRRCGGFSSVVALFFAKKSLTKTDRCAGALSWKRNQTMVIFVFGAFPSNRIPKATKGVIVHICIQSCKFL